MLIAVYEFPQLRMRIKLIECRLIASYFTAASRPLSHNKASPNVDDKKNLPLILVSEDVP